MRIRTVKPEFFTDEKVREMPPLTQLLFVGLWCFADDAGRFEADIPLIKAAIFPTRDANVSEMLAQLEGNRMIKKYKVRKKNYYLIRNWERHQYIRNPSKARTPAPPRLGRPRKKAPRTLTPDCPSPAFRNLEREREKEPGTGNRESVCRSSQDTVGGRRKAGSSAVPADGQADRQILKVLEQFFPRASIENLAEEFPPDRLFWAAERTRAAGEVRQIEKPASYLLRILRDEEQWGRYVCDQYALGRAEALRRQRELAHQRLQRTKELQKRKEDAENARLDKYLATIPERVRKAVADMALAGWAAQNKIDIEKHRKNGWLIQKTIEGVYQTQVRCAWKLLGRPAQYTGAHLKQLQRRE